MHLYASIIRRERLGCQPNLRAFTKITAFPEGKRKTFHKFTKFCLMHLTSVIQYNISEKYLHKEGDRYDKNRYFFRISGRRQNHAHQEADPGGLSGRKAGAHRERIRRDRHRRRLFAGRRHPDHRDELRLHLLQPGGRLRKGPAPGDGAVPSRPHPHRALRRGQAV